ncbi:MAG: ArsR/SmtB family transcription factor [Phycisphaerales bacterium]
MAPGPANTDAFTAIAEPRRRAVLAVLAGGERDVTGLVEELGWPQPQVSKHLGVLRRAALVHVARQGRRRVYRVNGANLRHVYEWVKNYERFWDHQLQRIKERAEQATPGAGPRRAPGPN